MAKTLERVYIYIWINLINKLKRRVANIRVTLNTTYLLRRKCRAWKKKLCLANQIRDG